MQIRELSVADAYEVTPAVHEDDRGVFLEWYRFDALAAAIGHPLDLRQANTSVSRRGVVRGIHFADVPRGQAKYVTVARGSILDVVVDIRDGSPGFGTWASAVLDDRDHRAMYVGEGLGHLFVALEDDTVVNYLVSDVYTPTAEHAINPFDPVIGIEFPPRIGELVVSEKDRRAPGLEELRDAGALPGFDAVTDFYASLSRKGD